MRLCAKVGDRFVHRRARSEMIGYACASEEPKRAARLWGAAERLLEEIGASRSIEDAERDRRCETAARAAMADDEAFDAAWRSGRALGFEAAVDYALATVLGPDSAG